MEMGIKTKTGAEKNDYETEETTGISEKNEVKLSEKSLFFVKKIASEQSKINPSSGSVRWLTTDEAAQYLRISISSIKSMIYRGQIRVHKLGRRNRFLTDELERLITLPTT